MYTVPCMHLAMFSYLPASPLPAPPYDGILRAVCGVGFPRLSIAADDAPQRPFALTHHVLGVGPGPPNQPRNLYALPHVVHQRSIIHHPSTHPFFTPSYIIRSTHHPITPMVNAASPVSSVLQTPAANPATSYRTKVHCRRNSYLHRCTQLAPPPTSNPPLGTLHHASESDFNHFCTNHSCTECTPCLVPRDSAKRPSSIVRRHVSLSSQPVIAHRPPFGPS
ncbi:hypothetical protein B0J11DRAFT_129724 [Dendryphion nanum]|uniref:Uncharacterized protein n=1 Tax=Dendryphion nanum TaxID=256645 RepID=A0A9P9IAH8_9PLEO|nr:hypothetical protein B0J11DRAFT_129724 [Dendryphion nanum]